MSHNDALIALVEIALDAIGEAERVVADTVATVRGVDPLHARIAAAEVLVSAILADLNSTDNPVEWNDE